jgi:hypothetical protein
MKIERKSRKRISEPGVKRGVNSRSDLSGRDCCGRPGGSTKWKEYS